MNTSQFFLYTLLTISRLSAEGFIAGTLVKTAIGHIPIEQIKVGDMVFAYSFDQHARPCTVAQIIVRYAQGLIKITIDQEVFFSDTNQLFISSLQPLRYDAALYFKEGSAPACVLPVCVISNVEYIDACAPVYTLITSQGNFCVSAHNLFACVAEPSARTHILQVFQEALPNRYYFSRINSLLALYALTTKNLS